METTEHPFGAHAAQILATEHWSLLATRSLIWNEAMSRATVFLTVLSASIIALALLADATGFGPHTTTVALVLLPVVMLFRRTVGALVRADKRVIAGGCLVGICLWLHRSGGQPWSRYGL